MNEEPTQAKRNGSGIIAAGRYVPPQGPLQRDPFEHMKLSLLTRGQQFTGPSRVVTCNTPTEDK